MIGIAHNSLFPDQCQLLGRHWFKDQGVTSVAAPTGATHAIAGAVGAGAQTQGPGGSAAFATRKFLVLAGEVFDVQVGAVGTGNPLGDSWLKRHATGEAIILADRAHGAGPGSAAACIAAYAESGQAARAGADAASAQRLSLGGRLGADTPTRAPGPGGGGRGVEAPYTQVISPAGQGLVVVEFYLGDPGFGDLAITDYKQPPAKTLAPSDLSLTLSGGFPGFFPDTFLFRDFQPNPTTIVSATATATARGGSGKYAISCAIVPGSDTGPSNQSGDGYWGVSVIDPQGPASISVSHPYDAGFGQVGWQADFMVTVNDGYNTASAGFTAVINFPQGL